MAAYFFVLFAPLLLWTHFRWEIQTSDRLGGLAALIAVPTCLVVVLVLVRVRSRLGASEGLALQDTPRWLWICTLGFVGYLSTWSAVFLALVAAAVHWTPGPTEHDYRATAIEECRGYRCRGCETRAKLQVDFRIAESVCVEDVRPVPKAGDILRVTGYHFGDGMYITEVRQLGAAKGPLKSEAR